MPKASKQQPGLAFISKQLALAEKNLENMNLTLKLHARWQALDFEIDSPWLRIYRTHLATYVELLFDSKCPFWVLPLVTQQ